MKSDAISPMSLKSRRRTHECPSSFLLILFICRSAATFGHKKGAPANPLKCIPVGQPFVAIFGQTLELSLSSTGTGFDNSLPELIFDWSIHLSDLRLVPTVAICLSDPSIAFRFPHTGCGGFRPVMRSLAIPGAYLNYSTNRGNNQSNSVARPVQP